MAQTKKTGGKKAAKTSNKGASKAEASTVAQVEAFAHLDGEMRAWAPALAQAQRASFGRQFSDADCDAWGAKTKAASVQDEAERWAVIVYRTLQRFPSAIKGYSPSRFAWYLEVLGLLREARGQDASKQGKLAQTRDDAEKLEAAAADKRSECLVALTNMAEGDAAAMKTLAKARGNLAQGGRDALAGSLKNLGELVLAWVGADDEHWRLLAQGAGLTKADGDELLSLAKQLAQGKGAALGQGAAVKRDSPETNRAEGRMLREMKLAMRAFDAAHDRNKVLPRLVPGSSTRHVLMSHAAGGDEPSGGEGGEAGGQPTGGGEGAKS